MRKVHMWSRIAMLGLIEVKCGRLVKATRFTNEVKNVTCLACLNQMEKKS